MKDEKINRLRFDNEFLLESAEKRMDAGDYLGALSVLNKREEMNEPLADAYALYADVYEALELWSLAADAWFRFLDTCNEADFPEGYEGVAVCFMNMGNEIQSSYYYRRALYADSEPENEGFDPEEIAEPQEEKPKLRLVHAEGIPTSDPETVAEGLALLRTGDLTGARSALEKIPDDSTDYPSAQGLAAMCTLMLGDEKGAERTCEAVIDKFPDNVQILTTYCAVLGAEDRHEDAKEVARKLAALDADSTDDLYRIATALCETGLDAEAKEKLEILKTRLPYDENVLWFHAVAACHVAEFDAAIESLEMLTLVYPRKAVAAWYLEQLRNLRDEGGSLKINYYYRLPEEMYRKVAAFFLHVNKAEQEQAEEIADTPEFAEYFRLAFDEMEGRDEKLQMLAAKVAVRCRADSLLRAVLLDGEGDEIVKLSILHDLVCRNEDNSFGTVICNLYKEFFIHEIELGKKKAGAFMQAFADVYSKYALLGEDYERKICAAGEDLYYALSEAEAWELFDERAALASAIYREARLRRGERSLNEICKLFDADRLMAQQILDYMM